ncbi:unnamed protein product [Discula destructiva]
MASTPRRTAWNGGNHPLDAFVSSVSPEHLADKLTLHDTAGFLPLATQEPWEHEWVPRLALGSVDADNLGALEAARRHMLQWEQIYEYNSVQNSGSLQVVEEHRAKARRVYEELCASDRVEDILPKKELLCHQNECIQARISLLRKTLRDAPEEGCEPMKENITAALKGYDTGAIGFSDNYTLIYAGRIVDTTAKSYVEFTVDRQKRLDRYFEQHGPGYFWWEPPLSKNRGRVLAKKGTCLNLDREVGEKLFMEDPKSASFQDDATHYKVPLGFRKDDSVRRRLNGSKRCALVEQDAHPEILAGEKRKLPDVGSDLDEPIVNKRHRQANNVTKRTDMYRAGAKGSAISAPTLSETSSTADSKALRDSKRTDNPTIFFDMLLDSGCELPILLHDDFALLGCSKKDANAASVVEIAAAAGHSSTALCFELLVGLELEGSSSEAWMDRTAYSESRFFPCRVIKLPPAIKAPAYGAFSSDRLSGMLPFLAYYMASAPGNMMMWLGEKRAEVLSSVNFPAGLKYSPFKDPSIIERGKRLQEVVRAHKTCGRARGLRKVTFETEMDNGGALIDEDRISQGTEEITSIISIVDKDGGLLHTWQQGSEQAEPRH